MKLDQIRAFIAVVEAGSFRSAADAIHKTQPSISAAVKTLENQYGLQLFDRDSYRPTLTSEGHAFFRQSKKLMSQVQQLEHLGHDLAHGAATPLRLCLGQMSLSDECLMLIKGFQQAHPDIPLEITTNHLYGVQESLQKDTADIAIGPRYGLDDKHAFIEISHIEMITVVTPGLLLSINGGINKVKQPQLYSTPQIMVGGTHTHQGDSGHRYVLATGKRWYINDFQAKKSLLVQGLGWGRIPRYMIETELEEQALVTIEVENFTSHNDLPIFMIRLRQQTQSSHANLFWEFIKSTTSS